MPRPGHHSDAFSPSHRLRLCFLMGLMLWAVCCAEAAAQTREDIRKLYFRNDFARIEELAKAGNPDAQSMMGFVLKQQGRRAEIFAWTLRAAENDNLFAIGNLALYYNNNKQHEEAARWYRRSAELGQVDHLCALTLPLAPWTRL
jgi:TPR repeat protein